MIPKLLSVDEAAQALNISVSAVRRAVADRRMPHRRSGGRIRFTESDLEEFVELQKVAAVSARDEPLRLVSSGQPAVVNRRYR